MADNLRFDRAEPTSAAAGRSGVLSCKGCGSLLQDTYYVVNGNIVCEKCRRSVEEEWERGGAVGRFGAALGLGLAAMIVCSIVWYVVLKATNTQFGILAVVVGFVVGGAVRKGSNGRGGWRYQALAILLTYTAIVSSYVPFIVDGIRQRRAELSASAPASASTDSLTTRATASTNSKPKLGPLGIVIGITALLALLYATPFLAGIQNVIGILIIGFALYEAWKLNRRKELRVSGPHRVATQGAGA
jgi:hypothetical protein